MNWDYGDSYKRFPIEVGTAVFTDNSKLKVHDIFNPLPTYMLEADLVFVDPPWNQSNISTFYTKAGIRFEFDFEMFCKRLFECISQINPSICYLEIGKEYLPIFISELKKQYKYVTFYNSTYYHKKENKCYIVRGSNKYKKPSLDGLDEENVIEWICENEEYSCIADLCMGRGLVAVNAYKSGKRFVGTELNHKRLSVTIEKLINLGAEYTIENSKKLKELREKKQFTQSEIANAANMTLRQYQRYEAGKSIGDMKFLSAIRIARKLNINPEELLDD